MANKKIGWLRIGRSGYAVDGRMIEPNDVREMAANYNMNYYTALIWPFHSRSWFNLGKVLELKAEDNDEGGVDLFAMLEGNKYYQEFVKDGQLLFTSMEIFRNFRKTGQAYMWGLGAVDQPGSVATSEVKFEAEKPESDSDFIVSEAVEASIHTFQSDTNEDQTPGWFSKFISQFKTDDIEDDEMSKELLLKLQTQVSALADQFNALDAKVNGDSSDGADTGSDTDTVTTEQYEAAQAKITQLEADLEQAKKGSIDVTAFDALKKQVSELTTNLAAALEEQDGTDAGEHQGESVDPNEYR
jgi:predicted nucleotidyltransferase